jgi:hypothetical protein
MKMALKPNMRVFVFLLIIVLVSFCFYWFQIRPTQIKHDCSWIKHHSDEVLTKKGLTESQLKEKGMLVACPTLTLLPPKGGRLFGDYIDMPNCYFENKRIIELNKPIQHVPAKDWWVKATKDEYTFCLHDKGL